VEDRRTIGNRIRRARERKGMTQAQLAALVGVGMRSIGNWERGETAPQNRLAKLEEVLEVDLSSPEPEPTVYRQRVDDGMEILFAHYGELTPLEKMRLAQRIQEEALRGLAGGDGR
jgi:transcriptional regulator with XRE-family HTH domain